MRGVRSFIARVFRLRALPETRRECMDILREIVRQKVPFHGSETPLARIPLYDLNESQALMLIGYCREKLTEHVRNELLRSEVELIRARGMGVLTR